MDPPAALRARRTSSSGRDAESSVASRLPWFFRAVRGRLPAQPSRQLGHKLAETVALVLQCVPSYGLVPAAPKRLDLPRPVVLQGPPKPPEGLRGLEAGRHS